MKIDKLPFILGMNQSNNIIEYGDFLNGHLAILGQTGSGKSCELNQILQSSMLFNNPIAYILVDFKKVELSQYRNFRNVTFIKEYEIIPKLLDWLNIEIDKRLSKFESIDAKKLQFYNSQVKNKLPYILIVFDESAELFLRDYFILDKETNKKVKAKIEDIISSLINRSRAAGIFFIFATQRCDTDSIPGKIRGQIKNKIYHYFDSADVKNLSLNPNIAKLRTGEFLVDMKDFNKNQRYSSLFINDEKDQNGNYTTKDGNFIYEKLKEVMT